MTARVEGAQDVTEPPGCPFCGMPPDLSRGSKVYAHPKNRNCWLGGFICTENQWNRRAEPTDAMIKAAVYASNHYPAVPRGHDCEPVHEFVATQMLKAALSALGGKNG